MTGTPLDLTPFGPLLSALGLLYWALGLAVAGLALWLPRAWIVKLPLTALLMAAFIIPVVRQVEQKEVQRDEAKERLDASMALFNERCKTAGEQINGTVENVDGVVWMKWRDQNVNYQDQFKLDDPYGKDCGAESCIERLLRVTTGASLRPEEAKRHESGYRFVETIDPRDGNIYRYTAGLEQGWNQEAIERHQKERGGNLPSYSYQFKIRRIPILRLTARYGITWDDISTREDREHWIAGGAIQVVDLSNNKVIAKRFGYVIDRGQGSTADFRSPWPWAQYYGPFCPKLEPVKTFVTKVLLPSGDQR